MRIEKDVEKLKKDIERNDKEAARLKKDFERLKERIENDKRQISRGFVDRARGRLRVVVDGRPYHVGCGGDCALNLGECCYNCQVCCEPVGADQVRFGLDLDELREWYARDVGQLLEMLEETHR